MCDEAMNLYDGIAMESLIFKSLTRSFSCGCERVLQINTFKTYDNHQCVQAQRIVKLTIHSSPTLVK